MAKTFEELAGQELDALYQGALFLSGGDARDAEALLVDTVTVAFQDYPREGDIESMERWLEARLVRSYLQRGDEAAPPRDLHAPVLALPPGSFEGLGARQLFQAAGAVPAWARATLWLVLLRRWSYAGAASALGVEREVVVELLKYRDVLISEILNSSRARPGLTGRGG